MSEHYHHFIHGATQITLPVTPESYTWGTGKYIHQVNISELGDVNLPGSRKRYSGSFQSFFPATDYPWLAPGGRADPQYYVEIFCHWAEGDDPVRYIVDGTPVNALVLIEGFEYSEKDGSGDVYYRLTLREWADVEAMSVSISATGTAAQSSAQSVSPATAQQYTIVAGDTLSGICRRFYGNGTDTYYNALAVYNGIKNPSLIYAGTVITLPPESELRPLFGQSPGSAAAQSTAAQAPGSPAPMGGASGRSNAMIQLFG